MYELNRMIVLDFKNLITNKIWVLYATLFPLLLVVILSFLGGSSQGSFNYFGITMMVFAALQGSSYSANAFMEERIKKANMRLIMLPIPSWFIPLSKIIATFAFTLVFYTLDGLILHWFAGINFGGKYWLAVWLFIAAIDLLAVVIGVFFCTLFKSESTANQLTSLVTQVLALLSGCFFPIYVLGAKFAAISRYSPITQGVQRLFALIYDNNFQGYWASLAWVILIALLGAGLSFILFKGEDYL